MGNRLVIFRKELRSVLDEKTIVLAITIQLFIAAFSSFLVIGLVAMYDPASVRGGGLKVGVAGGRLPGDVGGGGVSGGRGRRIRLIRRGC